jgi:hypothetical protein
MPVEARIQRNRCPKIHERRASTADALLFL